MLLGKSADSDFDGVADACDNCPSTFNQDQNDSDGDGFGDACDFCVGPGQFDGDGDGVCDGADHCPSSDLRATVVIGSCDTGVTNVLLADGCTIADRIAACAGGKPKHDDLKKCVDAAVRDLKKDHLLSGKDERALYRCI